MSQYREEKNFQGAVICVRVDDSNVHCMKKGCTSSFMMQTSYQQIKKTITNHFLKSKHTRSFKEERVVVIIRRQDKDSLMIREDFKSWADGARKESLLQFSSKCEQIRLEKLQNFSKQFTKSDVSNRDLLIQECLEFPLDIGSAKGLCIFPEELSRQLNLISPIVSMDTVSLGPAAARLIFHDDANDDVWMLIALIIYRFKRNEIFLERFTERQCVPQDGKNTWSS